MFLSSHLVVLFAGILVAVALTGDKCFGQVDTFKGQLCGNAAVGRKAQVLSAVIPEISGLVPHTVYFYVHHYPPVFFMYILHTQM
jgi:hypothetical protein